MKAQHFTFLSFEIAADSNREVNKDELGFYRSVLDTLGLEGIELFEANSYAVATSYQDNASSRVKDTVRQAIDDALRQVPVVVARFNFYGFPGRAQVDSVSNAIEDIARALRPEVGLQLLLSLPTLPDQSHIRWSRGLASGALCVISDRGHTLPSVATDDPIAEVDMDRWRYEARYIFGDDFDRFESKLTRQRGLFSVGEGHFVRFEYDASHATAELTELLTDWVRGHALSDRDLKVYWLDANRGWMRGAMQALSQDLKSFGVQTIEMKIKDGIAAAGGVEPIQPGARALLLLPVVEEGKSADLIREALLAAQVDLFAVYAVLTTSREEFASNRRRGVVTLGDVSAPYDVQYLLRVPQEHRRATSQRDANRIEIYNQLEPEPGSVNALDFWSFVRAAGAIFERKEEVPDDRPARVVPAFASGMLDEGFWLVDAFVALLVSKYEVEAEEDLLLFPEGDLASTMLRHGLRDRIVSGERGITCLSIPRSVVSAALALDMTDSEAIDNFTNSYRSATWRTVLHKQRKHVIIVDEFRTRGSGGTVDGINRLVKIFADKAHKDGADGAAVILDLFCEGVDSMPCASLYGWPSRQLESLSYAERTLDAQAADGLRKYLVEVLSDPAASQPTRLLAFDELTTVADDAEIDRWMLSFLPGPASRMMTNQRSAERPGAGPAEVNEPAAQKPDPIVEGGQSPGVRLPTKR